MNICSGNPRPQVTWSKVNQADVVGEGESLELREVFHNCPPHLYLDHYPSHHHHHYILWGKENLLSWERFVAKLGIAVLIIMYIVHPPPPPPHLYAHAHHHNQINHHYNRCPATTKASTSVVLATGWAETLYHINLN